MTTLVNEYTELGKWHKGPGGPFSCLERRCTHVEMIERNGRLYERRWPMFQTEHQHAPSFYWGGSERFIR